MCVCVGGKFYGLLLHASSIHQLGVSLPSSTWFIPTEGSNLHVVFPVASIHVWPYAIQNAYKGLNLANFVEVCVFFCSFFGCNLCKPNAVVVTTVVFLVERKCCYSLQVWMDSWASWILTRRDFPWIYGGKGRSKQHHSWFWQFGKFSELSYVSIL